MSYIEEARLRAKLRLVQQDLLTAESELVKRMTEIREFDAKIENRLGGLENELEILETEIRNYRAQIIDIQKTQTFLDWVDTSRKVDHRESARAQTDHSTSPPSLEYELRTLYRDLARRYHPDTAFDDLDRNYRNEMMMRINEAYTNRDLSEIRKLSRGMVTIPLEQPPQTVKGNVSTFEKLEAAIVETQAKLRETQNKIEKLRFHPSVQLSLNIKLAWKEGKDLIGEMAQTLQEKIDQKMLERDRLQKEYQELTFN